MDKGEAAGRPGGVVVHGQGSGHKVGNAHCQPAAQSGQELPPEGVYATLTRVDRERWLGVTNVGSRPSVDDDPAVTVETYMPGYAGDLYGRQMRVGLPLLRPVMRFDSLEAVKEQVRKDVCRARAFFGLGDREEL